MRLVPACAALCGAIFLPLVAHAQNDEPEAPIDEPAADSLASSSPSELLVPTPPEWRLKYEEARAKLLAGEFTVAAAQFDDLERTAVNRVDRAIAREQRTLAAEWSQKNLAFVNQRDLGESTASAKALDRRTTDELVSLYTNGVFYGLGTGVWLGVMTEPKSPAAGILPAIALTGAAVGTILALDSGRGFRYGVPQSIVTGLYIGLEQGIVWTTFHNTSGASSNDLETKEQATIIWGLTTAGAVTGGLLGQSLGTTPGRSSWVGSTALWTGAVFGFGAGAIAKADDPPAAALGAAGVGLTLGTGLGLATASAVSPSIARVRFIDLGGLGGGLLAAAVYVAVANDKTDGRAASGITALGGLGGLAAAWALTSSMAEDRLRTDDPSSDKSALARLRPMLMPASGGGMIGAGGLLP